MAVNIVFSAFIISLFVYTLLQTRNGKFCSLTEKIEDDSHDKQYFMSDTNQKVYIHCSNCSTIGSYGYCHVDGRFESLWIVIAANILIVIGIITVLFQHI